jgi:hypothetical protein
MRWLMIAHHVPGRTRLRTPVLRKDPDACTQVADSLAALGGVREVAVRPYTGSILVDHADTLAPAELVDQIKSVLHIEHVVPPGERPPPASELPAFSTIARELAVFVREVDRDIRRHSEGVADLGVLATLGCFTAGAAEVLASGQLPVPPWFNLAWWGFRLFMTTEERVIETQP